MVNSAGQVNGYTKLYNQTPFVNHLCMSIVLFKPTLTKNAPTGLLPQKRLHAKSCIKEVVSSILSRAQRVGLLASNAKPFKPR